MINIVIPMAGLGNRFAEVGYKKPKPFIDVDGKPMIVRVLENLNYKNARYILVARKEHMISEEETINQIEEKFNAIFIPVENITEGTACTVLYARKLINNEVPLLIANSDQIIEIKIDEFIKDCTKQGFDGSMLTFIDETGDSKWSYAKINDKNLVTQVQEKKAISKYATVGIYLFSEGRDFVDACLDMIIARDRTNNEYYTCPAYNYAIANGKKIGIYNIRKKMMHGIGTPQDLTKYITYLKNKN